MALSIDTTPEVIAAETQWIDCRRITIDDTMQPRMVTSEDAIRRYKDALRHGRSNFPPILVADLGETRRGYDDEEEPLLTVIDGWHRFKAHEELGQNSIKAKIVQCSRERAMWLAALSNTTHGLPLKRGDQRRIFRRYIRANENRKPDGALKSYREIVEDLSGLRSVGTIHKWVHEDFPKLAAEMAKNGIGIDEEDMLQEDKRTSFAVQKIKEFSLGLVRMSKMAIKEDGENIKEDVLSWSLYVTENLGHSIGVSPEKMFEVAKDAEWKRREQDKHLLDSLS